MPIAIDCSGTLIAYLRTFIESMATVGEGEDTPFSISSLALADVTARAHITVVPSEIISISINCYGTNIACLRTFIVSPATVGEGKDAPFPAYGLAIVTSRTLIPNVGHVRSSESDLGNIVVFTIPKNDLFQNIITAFILQHQDILKLTVPSALKRSPENLLICRS